MPTARTCAKCGVELSADALEGLCLKCAGALAFGATETAETVTASSVPVHENPIRERPGDRIGDYKVLEQIGEGGCGVVYVAEQEQPMRRRVALKVIKLGMDTRQVIARFEAERVQLRLRQQADEKNKRFVMAWEGINEAARAQGRTIRLFKITWENPLPEVVIESLDFRKDDESQAAAPFLVAITVEP